MPRLPYSRVVDVSLIREDRYAAASGFSVPLILQTSTVSGQLDATKRTKVYSDMTEIAVDWLSTTEAYKVANAVFSQNPRPRQLKIAYRNTANPIADEMNAIYEYDPDWYWGLHTVELRDVQGQRDLADWAESKSVLFGLESADVDTETFSTLAAASTAEYIESKNYDRTFVFYTTSASEFPAAALTGFLATRDLDRGNLRAAMRGDINSGNAYTAKFKKLIGITALNKGSAVVQAISGFIPGIGVQAASGHSANAYVNIGGLDMVVEGTVGSRAFIDEVHAGDWIVARTREALLSTLANNARIPYTNPGVAILTNAIDGVMRRAVAAGIIAGDIELSGGEEIFIPEYTITHDRVENVPPTIRRNRIAPDIKIDFRYSGAFHWLSASLIMRF